MTDEMKALFAERERVNAAYQAARVAYEDHHDRWAEVVKREFERGEYLTKIVWWLSRQGSRDGDVWVLESLAEDVAAKQLMRHLPDSGRMDIELKVAGLKFDRNRVQLRFNSLYALAAFCAETPVRVRNKDFNDLHEAKRGLEAELAHISAVFGAWGAAK